MSASTRNTRRHPSNTASTEYDSQASGNAGVISATAVVLLSAQVLNTSTTATLYIMFFDQAAIPTSGLNGTVPIRQPTPIGPGQTANINLSDNQTMQKEGFPFNTGCVWAASTTAANLTIDVTSSLWMNARTIAWGPPQTAGE